MRNKEEAKKHITEALTKLYDDNFDETIIVEALREIVKETIQEHKEAYECNCFGGKKK